MILCKFYETRRLEKNPSPRWDLNPRGFKSHLGLGFFFGTKSAMLEGKLFIIIPALGH